MRRSIAATAALLTLSGCAPHQWAPGPGHSVAEIEPAKRNCFIATQGHSGYAASGSTAAVAAGLITFAIADAIRAHAAFETCMQNNGFLVADDGTPSPEQSQAIIATPLPPPQPTMDEKAKQVASWAATQQTLNRSHDSGNAVALYANLCKDGDASACMMAAAFQPHDKVTASR